MENNNLNIRIQLFHEPNPFIYIQHDLESKRYRVSTNYQYLNTEYNLKIQFLRNFNQYHSDELINNPLIEVLKHPGKNTNELTYSIYFKFKQYQELEFKNITGTDNDLISNNLKIFKYIYGTIEESNRTSVIIFNKKFGNDSNYSLLFTSEKFINIIEFLSYLKQKDIR
jgi:hypothetical protein